MTDDEVASPDADASPPPPPPARTWTMLAYIAGDNDLSDAGLADIEEMCRVGTSEDVYAAVEIDTVGDWEGSIRYEIDAPSWDGRSYRKVIQRLPEQDSGNPHAFYDFVQWGRDRYPAAHQLLAVWGHGSGFVARTRSVASDAAGGSMSIPELARALRRAHVEGRGPLAILGFDACTMSMVEIAHELDDVAEILVASQALVPGGGWPYDWVLYDILALPSPEELAKRIVERFAEVHLRGPDAATQAAVRLDRIAAAHAAQHALGEALLAEGAETRATIFLARDRAQTYDRFADYIDVVDLCEKLHGAGLSAATRAAASTLGQAVADAVLLSAHSDPVVARSHGLSLWFPRSSYAYFAERGNYLSLRGNAPDAGWVKFLDALHDNR